MTPCFRLKYNVLADNVITNHGANIGKLCIIEINMQISNLILNVLVSIIIEFYQFLARFDRILAADVAALRPKYAQN